MFVSIACGAISGFHATQSPLMARCIKNEKYGRPIFFGSMITEGIVALIWAAAATYFYHNNGMGENNAAVVVDSITKEWLGTVGGILAVLGVIAAPIPPVIRRSFGPPDCGGLSASLNSAVSPSGS